MLAIINSRAKLPTDQAAILRDFKTSYRTIFSVNPKTEKSAVQTYILHLAPADTSGINVCAGAGNCKAICLHFAGNPVYMNAKQSARIRRTLAYVADPSRFMRLIVCAILDKLNKHEGEELAFRLNGTSDLDFIYLLKKYAGLDPFSLSQLIYYDYTKILGKVKKYIDEPRYILT